MYDHIYMVCVNAEGSYFKDIDKAIDFFLERLDYLKTKDGEDFSLIDDEGDLISEHYDTIEDALKETWVVRTPDDYLWIERIAFKDE